MSKDAFGWPTDALWNVAHAGENETWRVDTGSGSWAAKRYREGVTREAVEAEAATGYGRRAEDAAGVAAGAALRLLCVLGKLPDRLDVPQVAAKPARLVRRYLDSLEAELALTAATR